MIVRARGATLSRMRLALLIAIALMIPGAASATAGPVLRGSDDAPQGPAATAPGCPEQDDEEGGAQEALHVKTSGTDAAPGAGDEESDEDAPPKFSNRFYRRWFTMDASTDGFEAPELPVSIEAVLDVMSVLKADGLKRVGLMVKSK